MKEAMRRLRMPYPMTQWILHQVERQQPRGWLDRRLPVGADEVAVNALIKTAVAWARERKSLDMARN